MRVPPSVLLKAALTGALVLLAPLGALAQDNKKEIELTPQQLDLNNRAVDALEKNPPDTATAIKLMEAALVSGSAKADLLYMTLGRAYQLQDQCIKAKKYFDDAEQAPRVKGIPATLVPSRMVKYRLAMRKVCSGELTVSCNDPRIKLTIKGAAAKCGEPVKLKHGDYDVQATLEDDGQKANQTLKVTIEGARKTNAAVSLVVQKKTGPVQINPNPGVNKQAKTKKNTTPALIAGVSTLVVSGALWLWWNSADGTADALDEELKSGRYDNDPVQYKQKEDEYYAADDQAFIALPLAIGATLAGTLTTVLLYTYASDEPKKSATAPMPYVFTGKDRAGAGVVIRW